MFSKTRKSKLLGEIMREKVSSSLVPNTCLLHLKIEFQNDTVKISLNCIDYLCVLKPYGLNK